MPPSSEPPPSGVGPRRLLVVEDSPDYAALIEQMLLESLGPAIEVVHGDTLSRAVSALTEQSPMDGVLLDLTLPDADGLEALDAVRQAAPDAPVVVLTGMDDHVLAVRAVQEGAQDYLPKRGADAALLARSIRYAIERKRSELRLANQTLHSKRLVAQTIATEEQERRRLAQALHDGPLQDLAAVGLALHRVAEGNPDAITDGKRALNHAIGQLREALFDLYPPQLEHLGLETALRTLASEVSRRSNIQVSVEIHEYDGGAQDQLMFSLAREFLSNAERHAAALEIAIRVGLEQHYLTLEVEDDGRGIPAERPEAALRDGHIGLASMAERVEALGGSLSIRTHPGEGTLVRANVPARRGKDRAKPAATLLPGSGSPEPTFERRRLGLQG